MTEYTPGPWKISDDYGLSWDIESNSHHICSVSTANHSHEANARLIAAAPELLEALESAIQCIEFEKHPHRSWHYQAREAIRKATS